MRKPEVKDSVTVEFCDGTTTQDEYADDSFGHMQIVEAWADVAFKGAQGMSVVAPYPHVKLAYLNLQGEKAQLAFECRCAQKQAVSA